MNVLVSLRMLDTRYNTSSYSSHQALLSLITSDKEMEPTLPASMTGWFPLGVAITQTSFAVTTLTPLVSSQITREAAS